MNNSGKTQANNLSGTGVGEAFPCWPGETIEECDARRKYTIAMDYRLKQTRPEPVNHRKALLEEAIKITTEDRNKAYGSPEDNFNNIANLWSAYSHAAQADGIRDYNAADVAIMMILMKAARLSTNQGHRDSTLDIAGYAACLADVQESASFQKFRDTLNNKPHRPIDGVNFPGGGSEPTF